MVAMWWVVGVVMKRGRGRGGGERGGEGYG
jgi:hypothetical protein